MANIGYRTFNGTTDLLDVNIGNLASANSVPETLMFAMRTLTAPPGGGATEVMHAPGYDPLDVYSADVPGMGFRYQIYNGAVDATDGPTGQITQDIILVIRRGTSTAVRWSIATHNGSVWSSFTHTNDSITFSNRTYPGSGVLEFFNTNAMNARGALAGRCSTSIADGDVATLTTDLAAWSAIPTITNLWRFDQTPVVDLKGTATQNTLTGTSVTANGFPLDAGSAPAFAAPGPLILGNTAPLVRASSW
jgi:hypothetical protein